MEIDGGGVRNLSAELDRDVDGPAWSSEGDAIYFRFDDEGVTKVARITLEGRVTEIAGDVGGVALGRPYPSGSFTFAHDGSVAYTVNSPLRPADVAVVSPDGTNDRVTALNEDLLAHKELAPVEELWWESSHDGRPVQGWLAKPPGFDPSRKYPLILEIHGGPFANYGPRFAPEVQLYAAAGYLVLYTNPRGSTSYGGEFGPRFFASLCSDPSRSSLAGLAVYNQDGFPQYRMQRVRLLGLEQS